MSARREDDGGALVLVATPIGNLGDLSPRAVEALRGADLICCEDTRRTGRLLQHAGVVGADAAHGERPHRGGAIGDVLARLARGERVAVVSDAGMPGSPTPASGWCPRSSTRARVEVVPGPAARSPRWWSAGCRRASCSRGSCPGRGARRRAAGRGGRRDPHRRAVRGAPPAGAHRRRPGTACGDGRHVAMEAPHRSSARSATSRRCADPERQVALAGELTKLHEDVWRGTLAAATTHLADPAPRGEYVVVVSGAPAPSAADVTDDQSREPRSGGWHSRVAPIGAPPSLR